MHIMSAMKKDIMLDVTFVSQLVNLDHERLDYHRQDACHLCM
jgi:hypothetical protein